MKLLCICDVDSESCCTVSGTLEGAAGSQRDALKVPRENRHVAAGSHLPNNGTDMRCLVLHFNCQEICNFDRTASVGTSGNKCVTVRLRSFVGSRTVTDSVLPNVKQCSSDFIAIERCAIVKTRVTDNIEVWPQISAVWEE